MPVEVTNIKQGEVKVTERDISNLLKSKHEDMVCPPGFKQKTVIQASNGSEILENVSSLIVTVFMSKREG